MPADGSADRAAARRDRLAGRRKALGLTQEALAGHLDVDRSTVARWEHGQTSPLPWIRPRLARALRVSADRLQELLARDDPRTAQEQRPDKASREPRELPPAVLGFTGRSAELRALARLAVRPGGQAAGAVVISAIGGMAGVGKTALAVHWAHQVAGRFPDGQLYVNLRGFDPSGTPATPAEAVRGFLDALGVPPGAAGRAGGPVP
jgi:transcriptional regulator with XRE-family HTH domain